VVNLLDNAAKYTAPGGRIALSLELDGGTAILRVRDNGNGIAANVLPGVFDLFTQAERTLDHSAGGLGIGLSLVRELVQLHQGHVEAASPGTGRGTEIVVTLPLGDPASRLAPVPGAAVTTAAGVLAVLVVDDDVDAADSLALLLRMSGHESRVAYSGTTALHAAVEQRPSVVILDLSLPEMDGYELARQLRQHPQLADVPLIALSGHGEQGDRDRSLAEGFLVHLVKPVDLTGLLALLAQTSAANAARTAKETP
jgi:CheY-like chemotaxis protein/anti-sigma regulatory factor (Ser/Thr protein kinase)